MNLKDIKKSDRNKYCVSFKNAPEMDEGYTIQLKNKYDGRVVYEGALGDALEEALSLLGFDIDYHQAKV